MPRKTVSLDADVYRQIRRYQKANESISATLRRILEEEKDPADYLDELAGDFGERGVLTKESRARVRDRQKNSPRSHRPTRCTRNLTRCRCTQQSTDPTWQILKSSFSA